MNCRVWQLVSAACVILTGTVCAETETIDLRALAKKARPAVMLLVVSDAAGKEIATGTGFLVSAGDFASYGRQSEKNVSRSIFPAY
jgi:hypothetical protein